MPGSLNTFFMICHSLLCVGVSGRSSFQVSGCSVPTLRHLSVASESLGRRGPAGTALLEQTVKVSGASLLTVRERPGDPGGWHVQRVPASVESLELASVAHFVHPLVDPPPTAPCP